MAERKGYDAFFKDHNRHSWKATTGMLIGTVVVVLVILGTTGALAFVTGTGRNFETVESTERAPRGHVVRTHGWGGYYIGIGAGRRHFGGGGRIH